MFFEVNSLLFRTAFYLLVSLSSWPPWKIWCNNSMALTAESGSGSPLHIITPSYFKTSLLENKCVCASTVCYWIHEKLSFAHKDFHFYIKVLKEKVDSVTKSSNPKLYSLPATAAALVLTSNVPNIKQWSGSLVFRVIHLHWIHARYMY